MPNETPKKSNAPRVLALILIAIVAAVGVWFWQNGEAKRQREEAARELFEPAMQALGEAAEAKEQSYDIDKTVRVIHGIDRALDKTETLGDYLQYMARQDYRDVAPDVLAARKKVLDILLRLHAKQSAVDNQEATFTVTRTILSAMSLVEADFSVASGAAPALDKEQAKQILGDLRRDQEEREELLNELTSIENELIGVMAEYSAVYYKYIAEWDAVSTLRDRAYLALGEGNWEAALSSARAAAERAPHDTESRLIEGMALIQLAQTSPGENTYLTDATKTLGDYISAHPERTAPALLLLGVANDRMGKGDEARLNFQQAAAYYPKQADILTDMLDPYEVRSYLRKSREGNIILQQYASTMLGAGFFSPDLHLARMHFEKDEVDQGRQKILDHFSRRRNQSQWDLILADVEFCQTHLGPEFDKIFVEDSHLRLEVEPSLIGSKLDVSVENATPRPLYNATLLLALRFTDMHREDFEVFKVSETVPTLAANKTTDFGTLEVKHNLFDEEKGVDDIVVNRAILVTDDAVIWVDTDAYRLALARDIRERAEKNETIAEEQKSWFEGIGKSPQDFAKALESSSMDVDLALGKDDISMVLPRELALLNPVFRLQIGDDKVAAAPSTNRLTDKEIELEFSSATNLEADDAPSQATLVLDSALGNFEITLDLKKRNIAGVKYLGPSR